MARNTPGPNDSPAYTNPKRQRGMAVARRRRFEAVRPRWRSTFGARWRFGLV